MNFFEQQDRVKRKTGLLVFYFSLGVLLIVAAVNAAVAVFIMASSEGPQAIPFEVYGMTTALTLGAILIGTIVGIVQMSGGGEAVAKKLGARAVSPDTRDPHEKRLRNVVEEMAIASGIAVPGVYVFEGPEINAFAAGTSPDSAVVAVSEGALRVLDREELQGVVAHEFSHIFNGDMRLNGRLIGVLNGILLLAIIGRVLIYSRGRRNQALPLFGFALLVIGYAGVFMSRAIKSAVSRQREFLADASAVQFTRNPDGLLGALKKIGQGTSLVKNPHAEELSHFFFAQGFRSMFDGLFATHPPLADRIRAIDATARLDTPAPRTTASARSTADQASSFASSSTASSLSAAPSSRSAVSVSPGAAVAAVASVTAADINLASQMRNSIPLSVQAGLASDQKAAWVVAGLLLSPQAEVRARQATLLKTRGDAALQAAEESALAIKNSQMPLKLPVVELAIPTLRQLSPEKRTDFLLLVRDLIRADNRITPCEFAIEIFLSKTLFPKEAGSGKGDMRADALCLLSYLAYAGHPGDEGAARTAFLKGLAELKDYGQKAILPWDHCGPDAARMALARLGQSEPLVKEKLVAALAATVAADGTVTSDEWEVFRAVTHCLDCPTPLSPPNSQIQN